MGKKLNDESNLEGAVIDASFDLAEKAVTEEVPAEPLSDRELAGKPKAPDGGYGWVILIVAFFISFILDGCMYSFGIVLNEIKKNYGMEEKISLIIMSLNTGLLFASGPIASALAEQFGCRPVIMVAGFITACMNMVLAFIPYPALMIVCYGAIGGIATGVTYLTCFIILVDYFDKKLGIANGLTMAGSGVGGFVIPQITNHLLKEFDWKFNMIIYGCIMMQCVVLAAFLKPLEHPKGYKPPPKVVIEDAQKPWYRKNKIVEVFANIVIEMTNFRLLFKSFDFAMICVSGFFVFFCYFIPFVFVPKRAKDLFGDQFTWIISIVGIVNIPSRIMFGFLADRRFVSAIDMNTFCAATFTITVFVYMALKTYWLQCLFSVCYAFSIAGLNCLSTPYVCDIVGAKNFANANGILNLFRGIACVFGPIIAGVIFDKTASIWNVFIFCGASFAVAFGFSLLVSLSLKFSKLIKMRRERKRKAMAGETNDIELDEGLLKTK